MVNLQIVAGGHKVEFTYGEDRTSWECHTCSSGGSSSDELKAEISADTHVERNSHD